MRFLFFVFMAVKFIKSIHGASVSVHEYCVVGAGPAGLEMGYFLKGAGHEYVIFERSSRVGSFFIHYPRHRTLISINKKYTGKTNREFNLRHDWNSLISDDENLLFTKYSDDYFPKADDYLRYLNDYYIKLGLNVMFNTTISEIKKATRGEGHSLLAEDGFTMNDQSKNVYKCRYLIIATGIPLPNIPVFPGVQYTEGYENFSINPADFAGQNVLILGKGNSGFETANHIDGKTNVIHILGKDRLRLAWATHYVGDLRAINNQLLDTYQLKSLNGFLEKDVNEMRLKKQNGKLFLQRTPDELTADELKAFDHTPIRIPYDRVLRCLGFKFDFSLFDRVLSHKFLRNGSTPYPKYPPLTQTFELNTVPGIFFAGTNTHGLDLKKSAGGFIHGFRYTTRALFHHLQWRNHGIKWPSLTLPITELPNHILRRINEGSGNYQMFAVLGDVILLNGHDSYTYLEEFPVQALSNIANVTGHQSGPMIVWLHQYGTNFSGPNNDVFSNDRATGDIRKAHKSNFLHPVLYYYKTPPSEKEMKMKAKSEVLPRPDSIHHIIEDFLTVWDAMYGHILPLQDFINNCTGKDLAQSFDDECFQYAFFNTDLPMYCKMHYIRGIGVSQTTLPLT